MEVILFYTPVSEGQQLSMSKPIKD